MEEFPERMKIWIDKDIIVYLLIRDPHDREGELITGSRPVRWCKSTSSC